MTYDSHRGCPAGVSAHVQIFIKERERENQKVGEKEREKERGRWREKEREETNERERERERCTYVEIRTSYLWQPSKLHCSSCPRTCEHSYIYIYTYIFIYMHKVMEYYIEGNSDSHAFGSH